MLTDLPGEALQRAGAEIPGAAAIAADLIDRAAVIRIVDEAGSMGHPRQPTRASST